MDLHQDSVCELKLGSDLENVQVINVITVGRAQEFASASPDEAKWDHGLQVVYLIRDNKELQTMSSC